MDSQRERRCRDCRHMKAGATTAVCGWWDKNPYPAFEALLYGAGDPDLEADKPHNCPVFEPIPPTTGQASPGWSPCYGTNKGTTLGMFSIEQTRARVREIATVIAKNETEALRHVRMDRRFKARPGIVQRLTVCRGIMVGEPGIIRIETYSG